MSTVKLNETAIDAVINSITREVYMSNINGASAKIYEAQKRLVEFIKQNPSLINLKQKDDNI